MHCYYIYMLKFPMRLVVVALALLLIERSAESQQRKPDDGLTPTIRVEVNVVNILATVRDKHGALINNLTKDDFILSEDRQPQQIKYFARETDLPLTIGLLVDVSGSQYNLIDIERQAAYQFFTQVLRKGDKAFLISFRENVELLQDFTSSPRLQALTHCHTLPHQLDRDARVRYDYDAVDWPRNRPEIRIAPCPPPRQRSG